MAHAGFFLVLEGGEGAGKSSVAAALRARVTDREVVLTREPGGTNVAEAIRDLLLSDALADADPWCEALLFAAARADHVARLIAPALQRGALVVCDRFVDSSAAYQGVARGLGAQAVRRANAAAMGDVAPNLVVVLDIDPRAGLARATGHNRMEASALAFHELVRAAFLAFAAEDPDRCLVVDAQRPLSEVVEIIWDTVTRRMGASG